MTVRGACPHDCPDTCAWTVAVEDGRATQLRGDPEHPFTRGGLCTKVNRFLDDRVYHPDRLLHPLRRSGPKGTGTFTPVSWDGHTTRTTVVRLCALHHKRMEPHGNQRLVGDPDQPDGLQLVHVGADSRAGPAP